MTHCGNVPVIVTDYPADIKPFYMRANADGKTVRIAWNYVRKTKSDRQVDKY